MDALASDEPNMQAMNRGFKIIAGLMAAPEFLEED